MNLFFTSTRPPKNNGDKNARPANIPRNASRPNRTIPAFLVNGIINNVSHVSACPTCGKG